MRLSGGMKIVVGAQMDCNLAAREPYTSSPGDDRRFLEFSHAQEIAIESARTLLLTRGHRRFDLIDGR